MKHRVRTAASRRTEPVAAAQSDPSPLVSPEWRRPPPRKRKWLLIAAIVLEIGWVLLLIVLGLKFR
jgi:hypothetical protein